MPQLILVPVAVFAYNRPNHLQRTLRSLKACEGYNSKSVTVFCDGPKSENDMLATDATRAIVYKELGPTVDIRLASKNKGLATSIIEGVTELSQKYGRVIVIEDDLDLSPKFLRFMNDCLDKYANDSHVFQISGYMFEVPEFASRNSALFLPLTGTWGWATWDRAWRQFDPLATGWQDLLTDRALRRRFNLGGVYDYTTMLRRQMDGKRDSWGVRWYWSVFRSGGIVLFPPKTLVRNLGQDGSGSHGAGNFRNFSRSLGISDGSAITLPDGPTSIKSADLSAVSKAIWHQNGGWRGVVIDVLKQLTRK